MLLSVKEIRELTGMKNKNEGLNKIANIIAKRTWKNNLKYVGMDFKKQIVYFYRITKIDGGVCCEHFQFDMIFTFNCISGDLQKNN